MTVENSIWGVKAKVYFKANEELESLAKKIEKGLVLAEFTIDTDQDPPHEEFGMTESAGFVIWLHKERAKKDFSFVFEVESSCISEAVFDDRMHDVSLWMAKYISINCGISAFVVVDEAVIVEFKDGIPIQPS
jgi:hypothetical protein